MPFPPPGDLPKPGIEPVSLAFPTWAGGFSTITATWEAQTNVHNAPTLQTLSVASPQSTEERPCTASRRCIFAHPRLASSLGRGPQHEEHRQGGYSGREPTLRTHCGCGQLTGSRPQSPAVKGPQGVTPGEHSLVYPQAWTRDGPGAMSAWPLLPAALPTRGHTAA